MNTENITWVWWLDLNTVLYSGSLDLNTVLYSGSAYQSQGSSAAGHWIMCSIYVHLYIKYVLYIISYPLFVPRIWKGTHLKESVFPEAEG